MHYFIIKMPNKLHQIAFNHLSHIEFQVPHESLQKMYCKTISFFRY